MDFISFTGYELHREYFRTQKLKMSIFEKSYPELVGKSCREILKTSIKRSEREEAAALLADIRAHEIYFTSFSSQNLRSQRIRQSYGSEADFLYQLTCLAEKCSGFVFVMTDRRGVPNISVHNEPIGAFLSGCTPILAVDLCEHAYFLDYFYDKQSYLKAAISHLDLNKLK